MAIATRFGASSVIKVALGATLLFSVAAAGSQPEDDRPRVSLPGHRHLTHKPAMRWVKGQPGAGAERGKAKGHVDAKGFEWTDITPSPDTRKVFVSSSMGDDANSGLYANLPVKTLDKAYTLMRDGYPDHMLLLRGDIWENEDFGRWKLSGRSKAEPMLIGAYGEGARPLVRTGLANRGIWLDGALTVEHIAIIGIELHAHTYVGEGSAEAGILFLGGGGDVLIEDCLIRGYKDNIVFNGFGSELKDMTVRGCVVVDSFSKIAHAQGLYAAETDGLLIEGCVFDHNGWSETVPGADPTIFNHNVYIQMTSSNVTVRNNLILNGASHAIQLRPGGVCEDNVILYNAIGVLAGNAGDAPPVTAKIRNNVIMYADDIAPDKPRGMGIDLQHVEFGEVSGNLMAFNLSSKPYGHAIKLHSGPSSPVDHLRITKNTIYDWKGGLKFNKDGFHDVRVMDNRIQSDDLTTPIVYHAAPLGEKSVHYRGNVYHSEAVPVAWFQVGNDSYNFGAWKDLTNDTDSMPTDLAFADPNRSPQTYQAMIGGSPGLDGFIEGVRAQSRDTWNDDYAVPAILAYFRAGFGLGEGLGASAGVVGQ